MESSEVIKRAEYGGSNPVENVQALASKSREQIPARYLRCESEVGEVSIEKQSSFQIPVIDMAKLVDDYDRQHPFGHPDELAKLHSACKDYGFFQLINHGVPEELIEKMKISIDEFLKLPLEEKKLYSQLPNSVEGYGQAFVVSEQQKLDWADMFYIITRPISLKNYRFWPTNPTCFSENLEKYSLEMHKVGTSLLKFMSKNLRVDSNALSKLFEGGRQGVRINLYPPCAHSNKVLGISPHSDATGLTLLLQLNHVQGLQIINNGTWIPVKPIPGAFIINIGDIIEIMSNGEYKSIEHRVIVNPENKRLSVATFHNPNINATIGPLLDLVKYSKANYKSLSYEDYLRLVFSSKLDGKSLIHQMKIEK